jgi:hypothetical protein
MRNISGKFVEKIKTRISCSVISFSENRAVCEIFDRGAREATHDNIMRRMRFARWIVKATNTFMIFNTSCFATATVVRR